MERGRKKTLLPYVPGYENNAVLRLIFFVAGAYVLLGITWAIMAIVSENTNNFNIYITPHIALPSHNFSDHWWTVLTYGFLHFPNSFMEMLSNMLWLYFFGSVLQMLMGKQHIVPIFLYSVLMGGVFYLLMQLLPGELGKCPPYIMGPRAGLVGICAAAFTLSPKYRFWFTDTFSIPIAIVAGVFGILMILGSGYYISVVAMMAGGGITGWGYIRLVQAGYRPGEWMSDIKRKLENTVTPKELRRSSSNSRQQDPILTNIYRKREKEKTVDDILDKINQKGYKSLTAEEREILNRAGNN